jgi:hypothetical protein
MGGGGGGTGLQFFCFSFGHCYVQGIAQCRIRPALCLVRISQLSSFLSLLCGGIIHHGRRERRDEAGLTFR